jgi:hypothetical protein
MHMQMEKILVVLLFVLTFNSCKKTDNSVPDYFMTAQINGMSWSADKDYGVAQLDYNYDAQAHFLWIWSQTYNPLANAIRYQIGIHVNNPVSKGKYYFNNNGIEMNAIGGVSGSVYGWKKNSTDDYFSGHSINGFVEITNLTKKDISGVFEFTAVTEKSSTDLGNETIFITNGKFHVPINGVTGKEWDGPK